jgi:undecaprenyl-diphosphatase
MLLYLIAIPQILGWEDPGLAFDVALHLGTLVAVIAFFGKDWINLISSGITKPKSRDGKLFWYIVIASIPGAIIGK